MRVCLVAFVMANETQEFSLSCEDRHDMSFGFQED